MSTLVRSTAGRAVALQIRPRPLSIADSQQVLRVLQEFGQVQTFRHLKYETDAPAPNRYIAVFSDASGAGRIIAAQELDFEYPSSTRSENNGTALLGQHHIQKRGTNKPQRRIARMFVKPSSLNEDVYTARQAYHGSYGRSAGAMFDDLHRKLPRGLHGMASIDYGKGEVPLRIRVKREKERELCDRGLLRLWTGRSEQVRPPS